MAASKPITVVATLGGQPQVVTFALDALLQDYTIKEMIVLYLASSDERMVRALGKLAAEFKGNHYRGYSIPFKRCPSARAISRWLTSTTSPMPMLSSSLSIVSSSS